MWLGHLKPFVSLEQSQWGEGELLIYMQALGLGGPHHIRVDLCSWVISLIHGADTYAPMFLFPSSAPNCSLEHHPMMVLGGRGG